MSDAKQFSIEIDKFLDTDVPEAIMAATKAISMHVLNGVVMKTPVDTGRARGNWIVSLESPVSGTVDKNDKAGSQMIAEGTGIIGSMTEPKTVFVQNNLPYIERLENGYSKQSPAGMVAITVAEISAELAK